MTVRRDVLRAPFSLLLAPDKKGLQRRGSLFNLSQHPDDHRPERPVLLAVDQESGATPTPTPRTQADPIGEAARRKILVVEGYRITHMTWNPAGDHHHPTDVTYVKPDGSQATISADSLPFVIEGDVTVETMGVVVRSGVCTKCGQRVMPSTR